MSIAPGWYKDPADPATQRWWDGEGWVGEPIPADQTPPPGPPPASDPGLPPVPGHEPRLPEVPGVPGAGEVPPSPGRRLPPFDRPEALPGRERFATLPIPGLKPGEVPRPHGYPLAPLHKRLLARLVDIAIVFALNVVVNGFFVYQYWQEISPMLREAWRRSLAGESMNDLPQVGDQAGYLQLVILILVAALWFAYEVPAVANTGQTPGKRLLRIRVVPIERNEPLSFGRSFRRWNTMGLPTLLWWCFGIGFVLQLLDALFTLIDRPLQQALHDKSAQTVVVSIASGAPPSSSSEQPSKETPDEPADPS